MRVRPGFRLALLSWAGALVVIFVACLLPIVFGANQGSGTTQYVEVVDLRDSGGDVGGIDGLPAVQSGSPVVVLVPPGASDPCARIVVAPPYCGQLSRRPYFRVAAGDLGPVGVLRELYPGQDITVTSTGSGIIGTVVVPREFDWSSALLLSLLVALLGATLVAVFAWYQPTSRTTPPRTAQPAMDGHRRPPSYQDTIQDTNGQRVPPRPQRPTDAVPPPSKAVQQLTRTAVVFAGHAGGPATALTFVDSTGGYVDIDGIVVWARLPQPGAVVEPGEPVVVRTEDEEPHA